MREGKGRKPGVTDLIVLILLLLMAAWLLILAQSSTALICLILGVSILFAMKVSFIKRQARYLGTYLLVAVPLVVVMFSVHGILESIAGMVGKDLTMTGRTELWADVLSEPINRLLGTGYQSFWLGSRVDYLWGRYLFHPRQAHNGYIETYLNGGLLGLGLLVTLIMSIGNVLKKELNGDNSLGILLFAFWVTALFYNCTEARFSGPNLLWIILGLAALYHPSKYGAMTGRK
jgi:exopolysaccharide production protein ExoQ